MHKSEERAGWARTRDGVLLAEAEKHGKVAGRDVGVGARDELEGALPELLHEGLHEKHGARAPVVGLCALVDLSVLLVPHVLADRPDGVQFGIGFLDLLGDPPPQEASVVNLIFDQVRQQLGTVERQCIFGILGTLEKPQI